jgi:O-antigen/teichoic acid export membrane protein
MRSFWWLRVALIGLGLTLAVLFVARGSVLIGVIIGALAVVRAVVLILWWRRRHDFARRSPRRFAKPSDGPGDGFGPG